MTEGVRRIEHVEAAPQTLGVRRAEQQVSDQPLAGGDLLVGQHVPRSHLQPTRLHQCSHIRFPLGARP